jgi:hypothetical protein
MRELTAAEKRGMEFVKSGDGLWLSVNGAYVIIERPGPWFEVRDGHSRLLDAKASLAGAIQAARDHLASA